MNFSNYPLLKILIPYVIGLLWGYFVHFPGYFCQFSFFIAVIFSWVFRNGKQDFINFGFVIRCDRWNRNRCIRSG